MKDITISNDTMGATLSMRIFDDGTISLFVKPFRSEYWLALPLTKREANKLRKVLA